MFSIIIVSLMLPLFNTNVVNDSNFVVNYHGDYKYSCKNRNRRINPTVPALFYYHLISQQNMLQLLLLLLLHRKILTTKINKKFLQFPLCQKHWKLQELYFTAYCLFLSFFGCIFPSAISIISSDKNSSSSAS